MRYNENGMTDNMQAFCDEYLKDRNATRAYKAAYPRIKNDNSASTAGARLLRNVRVASYIARQEKALHDESIADAAEVRRFLTDVMRGVVPERVPIFTGNGVQELAEAPVNANNRIRAAELLGKLMGLFTDQVRLSVTRMPKITAMEDGSVLLDDPGVE